MEYKRTSTRIFLKKDVPGKATVYQIKQIQESKKEDQKMDFREESEPPKKEQKIRVETEDSPMETEEKKEEKKEEKSEEKEYTITRSVPCDRCKQEIKLPLPVCLTPTCDPSVHDWDTLKVDNTGMPVCKLCNKRMAPIGSNCPSCSFYCCAPGETVDISRVNFGVPLLIQQAQKAVLYTANEHDMPMPPQSNPDISKDHAINERIFNQLPLTEVQKEELMVGIVEDQLGPEEAEKMKKRLQADKSKAHKAKTLRDRSQERTVELKAQSKENLPSRKPKPTGKRTGVKEKC